MIYRLENWSVRSDPYSAPEAGCTFLVGHREGDPEGKWVCTSMIVASEGNTIHTESGSTYVLGAVDPGYLEFLASNDYQFDPANPIRKVEKITRMQNRKPK